MSATFVDVELDHGPTERDHDQQPSNPETGHGEQHGPRTHRLGEEPHDQDAQRIDDTRDNAVERKDTAAHRGRGHRLEQ